MALIEVAARYPVAPDVVWNELRHLERHGQWMSDAVAMVFATDQREGVGTSFRCTTRVGPFTTQDLMTITEWVDGATMDVQHSGLVSGRGSFVLKPEGFGSSLSWSESLHFPWWALGPIGAYLASPVLKRLWARNLRTLGSLLTK